MSCVNNHDDARTGWGILSTGHIASVLARDLALRLKGSERVSDWTTDNANMFRALKLEKTMMAILLSLIIAMGAFNLVSSQVMLVTDKQADIAILRTLGLSPRGADAIAFVAVIACCVWALVRVWRREHRYV